MANAFSREEKVQFDQVLEGFNDAVVATKMAKVYMTDQTTMERTGDIIWRPQPYIMQSFSGNDQSANFGDVVQLSVPAYIDSQYAVPFKLTARELRDQMQEGRLGSGAKQKLASDINISLTDLVGKLGSIVITKATALTGYDDVALIDSAMNEMGIPNDRRVLGLNSRDYNNMAGNLASRTLDNSKSLKAYEKAFLGDVASFETYKLNYSYRLAIESSTTVTITNATPLYYTPVAYTTTAGRGSLNVDNRYQTITIGVVGGTVKVGDAFTIAGVEACHHITKVGTGQSKTFRIVEILTGAGGAGTVRITPPIISGAGGTAAELQYKNVVSAPTNGALMTPLNIAAANVNPFWHGDAVEILPGRLAPAPESGMAVMKGTTDDGIELTMTRQGAINDLSTKYRFDALWGANMLNPEMAGILIGGQA